MATPRSSARHSVPVRGFKVRASSQPTAEQEAQAKRAYQAATADAPGPLGKHSPESQGAARASASEPPTEKDKEKDKEPMERDFGGEPLDYLKEDEDDARPWVTPESPLEQGLPESPQRGMSLSALGLKDPVHSKRQGGEGGSGPQASPQGGPQSRQQVRRFSSSVLVCAPEPLMPKLASHGHHGGVPRASAMQPPHQDHDAQQAEPDVPEVPEVPHYAMGGAAHAGLARESIRGHRLPVHPSQHTSMSAATGSLSTGSLSTDAAGSASSAICDSNRRRSSHEQALPSDRHDDHRLQHPQPERHDQQQGRGGLHQMVEEEAFVAPIGYTGP